MTERTGVTVIAAARNEAVQALAWLEHLRFADRVLVVDTGSVDGTIEILERGGAEVDRWPCEGPALIHAAKNRAIRQVASGFILDLDLDERVTLPLKEELLEVARTGGKAAYTVPFRHYVFGRWLEHGGWRDRHIRVYRAGSVEYPEDRAHSTPRVAGEIGALEGLVVHFAHPTLHDFLSKMNRYTSQDALLILEHGHGGLRNRPPLEARALRWLRASLATFWNRYVKEAGFRDGVPGFLAAALLGAYVFVEQAKVWEAAQNAASNGTDS